MGFIGILNIKSFASNSALRLSLVVNGPHEGIQTSLVNGFYSKSFQGPLVKGLLPSKSKVSVPGVITVTVSYPWPPKRSLSVWSASSAGTYLPP